VAKQSASCNISNLLLAKFHHASQADGNGGLALGVVMSLHFLAGTELRAVSYCAFEKGKLSEFRMGLRLTHRDESAFLRFIDS
jgi:hypothetical protein